MSSICVPQVYLSLWFKTLLCFGNELLDWVLCELDLEKDQNVSFINFEFLLFKLLKTLQAIARISSVELPLKQTQNFKVVLNNCLGNLLKEHRGAFLELFLVVSILYKMYRVYLSVSVTISMSYCCSEPLQFHWLYKQQCIFDTLYFYYFYCFSYDLL